MRTSSGQLAGVFGGVGLTRTLWRRLGRPAVVLCPSTAIQAQWLAQWREAFSSAEVPATASRELPTPLTVLTYQALCTLGAAGPGDVRGDGAAVAANRPGRVKGLDGDGVLSLLHPNGRELIARLRAGGPWTLVLDECHHLLELWGRLLQAVIGQLDRPGGTRRGWPRRRQREPG